jgi:two-component system nitrogen regulation response regulator NtrX
MSARQILVVDDEVGIRELLRDILQDEGFHVRLAENASQAREAREQQKPDLVLLDIWMPDCDGISLLKEWAGAGLLTMPVVMMSGHGTIDTAVEATRIGAFDFLEKPIALQKLLKTVSAALKHAEQLPKTQINLFRLGKSAVVNELRKRLEQVADQKTPVLLIGERGTGAELCARFLHQANSPWLELSEHSRLSSEPLALLAQCEQGVLFIPEVAELDRTQQKGLSLLIGSAEKHRVRVICATTQPLPVLVEQQQFDGNLLQTLSVSTVQVPSLNQHKDDIPDIVRAMGVLLVEANGLPYRDFETAALNALRKLDWPGNWSQLDSVVRNLMQTSLSERIGEEDVRRVMQQFQPLLSEAATSSEVLGVNFDQPLREARDDFERLYFDYHIQKADRNMSKVAETVELERTHLYRKLKQLGIKIK